MTEKQPFWKNNILWVWSEYYNSYIANYGLPINQILCTGMSISDWKEMMGLDKYEVIE